ncbi:MAG: DnaJ domain-containing protein [Proteobacteria bacterium]|nr:DnaJ domain-containing protein [Pseudomonadota bacterium]MBU1739929.1 DnaJ domain-containing protein [Pseudomonadota bacterium]
MPDAFPLHWPQGWARTPAIRRRRSQFGTPFAKARDGLLAELRRLGARYITLSTNIELRLDGLPYANRRQPDDPAVAVYFELNGTPHVLACDKWDRVNDNTQAIRKHVEAIRGQDRWGVGTLEQAFSGYKALPDPSQRPWWEVLGVGRTASEDEINAAYRIKVRTAHPDHGGDAEAFKRLTAARDQARKEKRGEGGQAS